MPCHLFLFKWSQTPELLSPGLCSHRWSHASPVPGCSTAEVFATSKSPRARSLPSLLCSDINALAHKKCQQMPSSVKRQVVSVRQRRDFLQKDGTCWVLWAAHANPCPCATSLLVRQPWCPCEPARSHSQPGGSTKTSFEMMFPAAALCPSVGHGGMGQGVPAGSLSLLCVLGMHPQVTVESAVARAPKSFGLVPCSCRGSVGQRCNENIKHQIQVHCSPTDFSLLPSGQRFSALPPTSSLFASYFQP